MASILVETVFRTTIGPALTQARSFARTAATILAGSGSAPGTYEGNWALTYAIDGRTG